MQFHFEVFSISFYFTSETLGITLTIRSIASKKSFHISTKFHYLCI